MPMLIFLGKDNLRFAQRVPFGKRRVDGRLVDDRRDMIVSRYIVELRLRQNFPWLDIVAKLNEHG